MIAASEVISASEITPGPLGIAETSPMADAPAATASESSSAFAMQQILTRGWDGMRKRSTAEIARNRLDGLGSAGDPHAAAGVSPGGSKSLAKPKLNLGETPALPKPL